MVNLVGARFLNTISQILILIQILKLQWMVRTGLSICWLHKAITTYPATLDLPSTYHRPSMGPSLQVAEILVQRLAEVIEKAGDCQVGTAAAEATGLSVSS